MADYPVFEFTTNELVRVGKALRSSIPVRTDADYEAAIRIFQVAYSWRDSHAYPMNRIRRELLSNVRKGKKSGVTSARLKRMESIKRKLKNSTTKLNQMQDLGGCRAIMSTYDQVQSMVSLYRNGGTVHTIKVDTDYIDNPRNSGYRGHHFVLEFHPQTGEDAFARRRVEVQIRTRLQHAWSTAVEAVGTARGEELKSGFGNSGWLRFFALMASEIAQQEGCPIVPETPFQRSDRVTEIADLERKLDAILFLDNINEAFQVTNLIRDPFSKFFVIQIDNESREIRLQGFGKIGRASDAYAREEKRSSGVNTVLVEVDKVGSLKVAYPNYFMDVGLFLEQVRKVININDTASSATRGYDFTWLRDYRKR